MIASVLDRAIGAIAPDWGARRALARLRLQSVAQMSYDAASRTQRAGFRRIQPASANAEIWQSLGRLRDVCRELGRNNPYAANVHNAIPLNVVGAGILPGVLNAGLRAKTALQALIKDHLETPAIDFDGRNNLYGLESLAVRTMVEAGEVLIVRYVPPARLKLPVPVQVRVLDPDYLDSTKTGAVEGGAGYAFMGVEFDADGRRTAYWLYDEHPGGSTSFRFPQSRRVPASEVCHLYRLDRPGQVRGVPWGAPVVTTLWDLTDYEDAELMRQKIAACFAVFFTGGSDVSLGAAVAGQATATLQGNPIEVLEPGMIRRLPQGADVKFATPPAVQGYGDVSRASARKIACGYGVPYEIATGDLSQVSFISGRLGLLQYNLAIDQWRWHLLIPHACAGIGAWFLQAASLVQGGPVKASLDWTPPRREMVDPKTEVPAIIDAIRAGLTSKSAEVRKFGENPETMELEQAADNTRADALKLRFDSDGRFPKNVRGAEVVPPDPGTGETPGKLPAANGP